MKARYRVDSARLSRVKRTRKPRPQPDNDSLYPIAVLRAEIIAVGSQLGEGWKKDAAGACGLWDYEFSKKLHARTARRFFNVEELGRLASFMAERFKGIIPPGWPGATVAGYSSMIAAMNVISKKDGVRP